MRNKDNDTGTGQCPRTSWTAMKNTCTGREGKRERKIKHVSSVFCFSFAAQLWAYCVVLLMCGVAYVWCMCPPTHTQHSKLIGMTLLQAHSQACFINFLGIPLCSQTDLWINCHNYYPFIWPLTCHRGMQRGNGAKRVVSEQGSSKVVGRQVVITHLLTYSHSSNHFPLSTETLSTLLTPTLPSVQALQRRRLPIFFLYKFSQE